MNAKIASRIGIAVAATSTTFGLFLGPAPAHGENSAGAPSSTTKINVRVVETASANIRLTPSAVPLSGVTGAGGTGRALASADFDEDGVPDLVTGYADTSGGRLVIQRGNIDAIYPNSPEANTRRARGDFSAAAFHPARDSFSLAQAADFLGAGDFDADGHWDIVAAARGGTKLYWLRGDGHGNFDAAQVVEVGGAITALAVGEINRVDGLTDIAVGVAATEGARVLIFESAAGALRGAPESFPLAAPAVDFAFGALSEEGWRDLAIASGSEVVVVHGRDRKLSLGAEQQAKVGPARLTRTGFESAVLSIAVGDFAGDSGSEMAVLTANGDVRFLGRGNVVGQALRLPAPSRAGDAPALQFAVTGATTPTRLVAAKVSSLPKEDLLVFDGTNAVQILTTIRANSTGTAKNLTSATDPQLSLAATLTSDSEVTSVLPLRLSSSALSSLVVLGGDSKAPSVVTPAAAVTFTVNSTADTDDASLGNGECKDADGNCTLRAAIEELNANTDPGPYTINFNIPGAGVPTITQTAGPYSGILKPVVIDGTTQAAGRVEIIGQPSANNAILYVRGGNSTVQGLVLSGGSSSNVLIRLGSATNNVIEGCYFNTNAGGTAVAATRSAYSIVVGTSNNRIGGTTAAARNVISGATNFGIYIEAGTGNLIQGNYIGTNAAGTAAIGNRLSAIRTDAPGLTVGGTTAGAGNLISGNEGADGVGALYFAGVHGLVQGNLFGTDASGKSRIGNGGDALYVSFFNGEPGVPTIGGTTPAARNIISGSNGRGIYISICCRPQLPIPSAYIQGNYIGTNADGTVALPNLGHGIGLGGSYITVGGAVSGAGNLISGNGGDGINVTGDSHIIQGNFIGTDVSGTIALPNQENGANLALTDNVQFGGAAAGERNLVSGNTKHGLVLGDTGTIPGRIQGNLIGLNVFGTGALGNGQHGINFSNTGGHLIGGTEAGAGNIIAFNGGAGIASSRDHIGGAILSNSIFANRGLGLDLAGDGVTPYGGSRYSDAPVITSASTSGSETVISGNLRTKTFGPQGPFRIQFFSNTTPDPSGYGEGQTFIGETTITAGGNVAAPFSVTITPAVPPGRYVSAVAIGVWDTQNSGGPLTSEFSFNVRVPGDPKNNPLSISNLTPALAGNLGDATITLYGEGIAKDATVVLRRTGRPDIAPQSLVVSASGNGLQATFALAGQSIGQWDIVVTNPDGTSFVLAGAFQIAQGVDADVWVDVIGRSSARPNQPQTYQVLFGNRGNTDAYGVLLRISMPLGSKFKILSKVGSISPDDLDPDHEAYPEGENWSESDPFFDSATDINLPIMVPIIPAGTTGVLTLQITFPDNGDSATLLAAIGPPLLESTLPATPNNALAPFANSDVIEEARQLRAQARKQLDKVYLKSNGDLDIKKYTDERNTAQSEYDRVRDPANPFPGEDPPLDSTAKALKDASKRLALALIAEAAITSAKTAKELVDKYNQIVGGPIGYVKDGVKKWGLDKVTKALYNIGDLPAILKDFANTMLDLGKKITPTPIIKIIRYVRSLDPNDKAGSSGGGTQHFITGSNPIPYGIFFENKPEASAPAQTVVITDQLDTSKLDLETLQWGPVAFGTDTLVTPPLNGLEWTADADLRPANNLIVRVSASLDKATGLITWRFVSIDPATNQPTTDPTAGFLPPDKVAPEGQGSVSFIIAAKPNQPEGTEIRNKARIVFDLNAPLDTPEWLNTIDHTPPSSAVLPLPSTNSTARFEVKWSGTDAAAGVAYYTIYVSENGGDFTPWLVNTTATSAFYQGRPNATYTFYSVAMDGAGNREAAPSAADTSTTTLAGQLLNIATRLRVQSGENVLIGGLIIAGPDPKRVIIRAIGPSLSQVFAGALGDPKLELFQGNTLLESNNDWKDSQQAEIEATTIPPSHDLESAIVRTLLPGNYTAVMSGNDGGAGIGVVEAYDLDQAANSKLANIATRGFVDSGDNIMIGGVIAGGNGGADTRVLIRAIGPSLTNAGIAGALQDPILELRNASGTLLRENDNWQAEQQSDIEATTIPPSNPAESAIVATLTPGNYTAIVRGKDNTTGVALVEVYNVK